MKSVLISIRPKWCEKIASGEKTIEVRKTAPKEVPFKAYIYCTKDKPYLYRVDDDNNFELTNTLRPKTYEYVKDYNQQNGKVIGEFICDKVYNIEPIFSFYDCYSGYDDSSDFRYFEDYSIDDERLKKTCLTRQDLYIYGKEKTLYGLHISDLKIYDKPKELSEFHKPCENKYYCEVCKHGSIIIPPDEEEYALYHGGFYEHYETVCHNIVNRPPQSWQYVEELEK